MVSLDLLYKAFESKKSFTPDMLRDDKEFAKQVQIRLAQFGFMSNQDIDGIWGERSKLCLSRFNKIAWGKDSIILENQSLSALINRSIENLLEGFTLNKSLATQVFIYFLLQDFRFSLTPNTWNLCSIRGMNKDGTLNSDVPFKYNDRFIVWTFSRNPDSSLTPVIKGNWLCTSQPGRYYWNYPMNDEGCAVLAAEKQFNSWSIGIHRTYPALVQVAPVDVVRGIKQTLDRGYFGINIHSVNVGQDYSFNDEVGKYSAGCTVFASREEFDFEFMPLMRQDARYKAAQNHKWDYVAISGNKFRIFQA